MCGAKVRRCRTASNIKKCSQWREKSVFAQTRALATMFTLTASTCLHAWEGCVHVIANIRGVLRNRRASTQSLLPAWAYRLVAAGRQSGTHQYGCGAERSRRNVGALHPHAVSRSGAHTQRHCSISLAGSGGGENSCHGGRPRDDRPGNLGTTGDRRRIAQAYSMDIDAFRNLRSAVGVYQEREPTGTRLRIF